MRPSLATKLAASSRACSTTLSLPDVLWDEADEPAAEVPAEVPAKLPAMAGVAEHASRVKIRVGRIIGEISRMGWRHRRHDDPPGPDQS